MWRRRRLRSASWLLAVLLLLVGLLSQEAAATLTAAGAAAAAASQGSGSAPAPALGPGPSLGLGGGGGGGVGGGGGATGLSAWPASVFHHRPIYSHQSVQSVLASIEERLRALDALYSARYAPRLDLHGGAGDPHAHAHARRLEGIESRLGRLETLLDLRLDKLTETISSRQLKDELAKDQLSRSVDSTFERLHHRLGYMETRLDVALSKLQASQDSLSARVERLDAGLGLGAGLGGALGGGGVGGAGGRLCDGRQGDVGADLALLKSGLDELRKSVHDNHQSLLNSTLAAVAAGESAMQRHFGSLTSALGHMQEELNRTLTVQNDGGGGGGGGTAGGGGGGGGSGEAQLRHERHVTGNLLGAVDRHAASFGSKVTNMYNELWRRTQILEGLTKDSMALSNATRRELQEGMRSVSMQLSRYCSLQADKAKPSTHSRDNIEATLEEIRTSTSSYFQTIISIQHMFQASCHRIQEHEPMLEKYLAETLERIVGLLTNNKWENQVEDLHRFLKSHHTTVVRNVGHTTNTILRAANYSSKEAQNLATVINEAHEGLLISTTDIQKGISGIQNEQQSVHQALKEITAAMNELQNKVSDLSNQNTSEEKYLKVIQCQENSPESTNITSEFKRMFEANQKHISKEIQNLTQSIIGILRSIGVHLPSHISTDDSEPSKKDFVNILTISSEQDYDDSSEHGIISETHEENLNSIYDSHGPQTEKSVLENFSSSHTILTTNKHDIQTPQTSAQVETSTPQPSNPPYDNNTSSPELTINIIPNAHNERGENQSSSNKPILNKINQNNQSAPFNDTFVTIVHNDKPLTSAGHVTYLSKSNASTVTNNEENNQQNQTFTQTPNSNYFTNSHKSDRQNKNHTSNDLTTDNPTTNFHDTINSNLSTKTMGASREPREPRRSLQHGNTETQTQDFVIGSDHNHYSNISMSLHQASSMNETRDDSSVDEQGPLITPNSKNHTEQDIHHKFPNGNSDIPRNTRHKNLNKNDTHYLYRLLNKLEELSNRLMNSESSDVSAPPDNSEHTDDSQEGSEEYQDYSLPDSTFSSK